MPQGSPCGEDLGAYSTQGGLCANPPPFRRGKHLVGAAGQECHRILRMSAGAIKQIRGSPVCQRCGRPMRDLCNECRAASRREQDRHLV